MELLQFCLAGFGIIVLRLLLFPICLISLILTTPLYFIVRNKDGDKIDKFLEFYDNLFMWLFGPPFGFFSVSIVFWIMSIYGLVYFL